MILGESSDESQARFGKFNEGLRPVGSSRVIRAVYRRTALSSTASTGNRRPQPAVDFDITGYDKRFISSRAARILNGE
jgi:hypothetical protein